MAHSGETTAAHEEQQKAPVLRSKYSGRVVLSTILSRGDKGLGLVGERVVVGGWVKSCKEIRNKEEAKPPQAGQSSPSTTNLTCSEVLMTRVPIFRSIARLFVGPLVHKLDNVFEKPPLPTVAWLRISDGSCTANLQIIIDSSVANLAQVMVIGTSILVEGVLKQPVTQGKHVIELVVEKVLHVGTVDSSKYPLAKTRMSSSFLRLHSHLRPRTTTVASITRIRNSLSHATHTFFQNNGFLHVEMPVITTTPSKNADEMFQVTTLLSKSDSIEESKQLNDKESTNLENVKTAIKEKQRRIEELKRSDSNREALTSALQDLKKANELASLLEEQKKNSGTSLKVEKLDFSKDYFSRPAYLSMSAGLHLESYGSALSSVYTLGPIFQAKMLQSKRHLAESWMLDVDLAFAELEDAMSCAEDYLKFMCQWILGNCSDDIKFISKRTDTNCIDLLHLVGSGQFEKITYTEAVEALKKVETKTFETKVEWGSNLAEEHESYLANKIYKRPIIIHDHPKNVKPFFLSLKDDQKTVSSFDIIVPLAGALIRGGQREERLDVINARIQELGLPREQYEWYLDLRRYGTVKHAGFSLGLDHMVMFATGIEDARDVIPFPRTIGNANP